MTTHIRQTVGWEKYFHLLNWKSFRLKNNALVVYYKTPFGSFGKMQRPQRLLEEDLLELDTLCKKNNFIFLKLEPEIDQDLDLLETFGYRKSNNPLTPTVTMSIDLTKKEKELWDSLSRSGKYGINRGNREGTKIEFMDNPTVEQLENYFKNIQLYTARDKHFYTPTFKDLLNRKKAFGKNTCLSLDYAKDGKLCGGKFYVMYEDTVLYLTGGTTEIGRNNRAGFVQMWESILYFKNKKYRRLDLDGIYDARFPNFTKSWLGFSRFKEKFGGEITRYPYSYIKFYSPLVRLLDKVFSIEF